MKKPLLTTFLLTAAGLGALAFEAPKIIVDQSFQAISPDGHYLLSDLQGVVTIHDLVSGQTYTYGEEDASYSLGQGNLVNNLGMVLGSTSSLYDAAYWQDGKWYKLAVPNENLSNFANGVTPDGSRICGCVGMDVVSLDTENLMMGPAYWDRKADGTFGDYVILPHPELDFTGRVPQYITAVSISADGKTIIGQVTDYAGMRNYPIVYTQAEDGEWSYKILLEDLFKPEEPLPASPGDGPMAPTIQDFMTDEEKADYQKALDEWAADGYDYTKYPNEADYASAEEVAEYEAAYSKWEEDFAKWDAEFTAFMEAYQALIEKSPDFYYNNVILSPDGKSYVTTAGVEDNSDPMSWFAKVTYTPWAIGIADNAVTKYPAEGSMTVNAMPCDDYLLVNSGINDIPVMSYLVDFKTGEYTATTDWLGAKSEELKEWMEENFTHEVEEYDWETGETSFSEVFSPGMAVASEDLKIFAMWTQSWAWDLTYTTTTEGYIIDLNTLSGVRDAISTPTAKVTFDTNGMLSIEGDVKAVHVYDLSGRQMFVTTEAGNVANNLAKGVYLVKALTTDGASVAAKLAK